MRYMKNIKNILKYILLLSLLNKILLKSEKNDKLKFDSEFIKITEKYSRNLQNMKQDDYQNICLNKNYSYELMEYIDPLSDTLTQVLNFTFITNSDSSESIINFIKDQDYSYILEYVIANIVYFLILIFAGITILIFIVNCGCCCFPTQCFRMREPNEEKPSCKLLVFLLIAIFSLLSIGCCIVSLTFLSQFLISVDSISCSVNKFIYEIKNGENKTTTPKWMGIDFIMSTFDKSMDLIPSMSDKYQSTFSDNKNKSAFFLNKTEKFFSSMGDIYAKYMDKKFDNINPRKSEALKDNSLKPDFLLKLGNYTDSSTKFGEIKTGISNTYFQAIESFEYIQENTNKFIENSQAIKDLISELKMKLLRFKIISDKIQKNFTDIWLDTRNDFNNQGQSTSLNSLIGLISYLVFNLLIMTMYACCKIQCCRFISHILWILLTFISFTTFLTAFGLGILSSISYDAKSVMGFIFSDENLFGKQYLINNKEAADILNVCLNYGGDLGSELYDIKNSHMIYLDKIYKYSYNILDKDFKISTVSDKINEQIKNLELLLDDVRLVNTIPNDNTITPRILLDEIRKWSDYYSIGSYQNSMGCKTITRDIWLLNNNTCPAGYPLKSTIDGKENLGSSNCFIIQTWSDAYVNIRYTENPYDCENGDPTKRKTNEIKDPDFASFPNAIYAYWSTLRKYRDWHLTVVSSLITDYKILKNNALEMENLINNQLLQIIGYVNPLFSLYNSFVGNTNIFNILNCEFLVHDFDYIMKSLELKVSSSSLKLCISVFFMSLFNIIIVILTLVVILRFRIIVRRKIKRNGYFQELDQESIREKNQEIEMQNLNPEKDYNYDNVNDNNENEPNHNNMNEIVVKRINY